MGGKDFRSLVIYHNNPNVPIEEKLRMSICITHPHETKVNGEIGKMEIEAARFDFARNDFWRLKSSYNESFPAVLGKLVFEIPELENANYLIEQDLSTAITYFEFEKDDINVGYKTFVSADKDIMVIELSLEGEGYVDGQATLTHMWFGGTECV